MRYFAYTFTVQPLQPGSEILQAMIAEMGFESFDATATGFVAFIPEETEGAVDLTDLQFEDFTYSVKKELIAQQNWNESWEKNFEPVHVDDLLLIRAPFHASETGYQHEIVIMPKMSFGTGHHQTTRLMCKQMFELNLRNKRVLDMGCGTAILAILAKKLGAAEVLGIDIDEWSVENGRENCVSNGYPEIEIVLGDVDKLGSYAAFDCIIANINKNILKAHLPSYAKAVVPGGTLLLSGFFSTDAVELQIMAEQLGFTYKGLRNENEWAMLHLQRNAS